MGEKARRIVENRKKVRRTRSERRQTIRWESKERRQGSGRRQEDKASDRIKSVYETSPSSNVDRRQDQDRRRGPGRRKED